MKVKAIVKLKNGVLDPQAKAIHHALHANGFDSVADVSLAKEIILDISESNEQKALESAKKMCEQILANVVIEEFDIEIFK